MIKTVVESKLPSARHGERESVVLQKKHNALTEATSMTRVVEPTGNSEEVRIWRGPCRLSGVCNSVDTESRNTDSGN
jgi:hypothetical protein